VLNCCWQQQELSLPALSAACDQQLSAIARLQPREQRLLRELGCGLLNKEIAARLGLSVATVETYRKQVAAKLGISGAELVRLATLYRAIGWEFKQLQES
jgi:DNA-binding NarL/FixJ family response regulator